MSLSILYAPILTYIMISLQKRQTEVACKQFDKHDYIFNLCRYHFLYPICRKDTDCFRINISKCKEIYPYLQHFNDYTNFCNYSALLFLRNVGLLVEWTAEDAFEQFFPLGHDMVGCVFLGFCPCVEAHPLSFLRVCHHPFHGLCQFLYVGKRYQ